MGFSHPLSAGSTSASSFVNHSVEPLKRLSQPTSHNRNVGCEKEGWSARGYGSDNLHLAVARGYVGSWLSNARTERWLRQQGIADVESIGPLAVAAE